MLLYMCVRTYVYRAWSHALSCPPFPTPGLELLCPPKAGNSCSAPRPVHPRYSLRPFKIYCSFMLLTSTTLLTQGKHVADVIDGALEAMLYGNTVVVWQLHSASQRFRWQFEAEISNVLHVVSFFSSVLIETSYAPPVPCFISALVTGDRVKGHTW